MRNYNLIYECFLSLYLDSEKNDEKKKKENHKDCFSILEKTFCSKELLEWYGQITDYLVICFIHHNILDWIKVLKSKPISLKKTLSSFEKIYSIRKQHIESLDYNPEDNQDTLIEKCKNSFQLFKESCSSIKNFRGYPPQEENLIDRIKNFLRKVEQTNRVPIASTYLGQIFYSENSIKSASMAIEHFRRSVELKCPEGCYFLGRCYFLGIGVSKCYNETIRLWNLSAELGYKPAYFDLATFYENGFKFVTPNIVLSIRYLFKSITDKYSPGVFKLKELSHKYPEFFNIYEKENQKDYSESSYHLSLMYEYGIFVSQNLEKARDLWFQGSHKDSLCLQKLEESFKEHPQDLEFYHQQAMKKEHNYNYKIGILHEHGLCGYEKDILLARKYWFKGAYSRHSKCIQKIIQSGENPLKNIFELDNSLEFCELRDISKEKESQKQLDRLFLFLNRSFDKIYDIRNIVMEAGEPGMSIYISQSGVMIKLFKLILSFDFITETYLLDWYYQYQNQDFVNLSFYYWVYLINLFTENKKNNLLKMFSIINREQFSKNKSILNQENVVREKCESLFVNLAEMIKEIDDPKSRVLFTRTVRKSLIKYLKTHARHKSISESFPKKDLRNENKYLRHPRFRQQLEQLTLEDNKTNYQLASYYLGLIYTMISENKNQYLSLSFLYLFKSTILGYTEAKFNLGYLYYSGRIVFKNFKMAQKLFNSASDVGQHDASYHLGLIYLHGLDVATDRDKALQYWFKGASENHHRCIQMLQVQCSIMNFNYYKSQIAEKKYDACYELGIMYRYGIRTKKSEKTAMDYFFMGLEFNNSNCLRLLESHFQEHPQQIDIYRKCSKNGHPLMYRRWSLMLTKGVI